MHIEIIFEELKMLMRVRVKFAVLGVCSIPVVLDLGNYQDSCKRYNKLLYLAKPIENIS